MAIETFTNRLDHLNDQLVQKYICPPNKVAIVHSIFCSNLISDLIMLDVAVQTANGIYYLIKDNIVPRNTTMSWDKPVNLNAGEEILARCHQLDASDIFISVLELDYNG